MLVIVATGRVRDSGSRVPTFDAGLLLSAADRNDLLVRGRRTSPTRMRWLGASFVPSNPDSMKTNSAAAPASRTTSPILTPTRRRSGSVVERTPYGNVASPKGGSGGRSSQVAVTLESP